jgi:hypothetical protein
MRWNKFALGLACAAVAHASLATPEYINGLALDGGALDLSGGTNANNGRIGYFSDIHYDAKRKHWWGLSDRGPGGGVLDYETRVQRFKLDIDKNTGAIGGFKVLQTIIFRDEMGNALNGLAPNPTSAIGLALDPEGFVVHPKSGHFLVSDEYGPSLYEFDREGYRVRAFQTPANLIPRSAVGVPNFANDTGNTLGKRTNRGFEGLAITPDGAYVYAMLQSAMLDEGGGSGVCNRIVKFDTSTGEAIGQYAYQMDGSSQGRGISALLALNNTEFLVLERNNRGVGAGADNTAPFNKKVFKIDLSNAADVSGVTFASSSCPAGKVSKVATPFLDLALNGPAALAGQVPEKWEGLALGPRLNDGSYLMLAGTDNDYSVTQNASNVQYDVYFRMTDASPYLTSIQCPLDSTSGCFLTSDSSVAASLPADGSYRLMPGVLVAYKVPVGDIPNFVPAVPQAKK